MSDEATYVVVRNDEEQYSIWRTDRELPAGWHAQDVRGTREECLDHIRLVWTDLRPLSARRSYAERRADTGNPARTEA